MQICGVLGVCLRARDRPGASASLYLQKPKLKPGNSLPLGVEELGQLPPAEGPGGRPLRKSFRRGESWRWPQSTWGREFRQALGMPSSSCLSHRLYVRENQNKCRSQWPPRSLGGLVPRLDTKSLGSSLRSDACRNPNHVRPMQRAPTGSSGRAQASAEGRPAYGSLSPRTVGHSSKFGLATRGPGLPQLLRQSGPGLPCLPQQQI